MGQAAPMELILCVHSKLWLRHGLRLLGHITALVVIPVTYLLVCVLCEVLQCLSVCTV